MTTTPDPLAARALALALLSDALRRRLSLDDRFDAVVGPAMLAERDRSFTRLLVATTLRRLGQIDAILAGLLHQPEPLKPAVQDLLRLGAAQGLFLGTPAHAAVDTTVKLAASQPHTLPYRPLINAVMRRLTRDAAALVAEQDAARLNCPDWLWSSWCNAYGQAAAEAIARAHLSEAPLDLTLKDPSTAATWAEQLGALQLPTGSLRLAGGGAVTELPGFAEGAWWVQDAAAAVPASLFGNLQGKRVVDLCAAPGGKTAQLAAGGAKVIAVDRAAHRLERLQANLGRLGLSAETVTTDAAHWTPPEPVDAVLLDAPCSATGTIRRHPDLPHIKRPLDIVKLVAAQTRLLNHAAGLLRPGGTLIYTVCSLQPEECAEPVARLLASNPAMVPMPISAAEVGGLSEAITEQGNFRSLPCHLATCGGIDGFFIARLRRTDLV